MKQDSSEPAHYQIRVHGQLDDKWSNWFSGLVISRHAEWTVLTGPVADQAALRGILNRIWDLNLTLVAVTPVINPTERDCRPDSVQDLTRS